MRIYEGSPRQDFEEVLRSIGAYLDERGMREILMLETVDGFVVQGLVHVGASSRTWSESIGQIEKETLTFLDDDISGFMDRALSRRGVEPAPASPQAGFYQRGLRIIGRYIDDQRPKDIFLFEQDGTFVVRLHHTGQTGSRHTLAEFTREDLETLALDAPSRRRPVPPGKKPLVSR